jgi:hypothetical protein
MLGSFSTPEAGGSPGSFADGGRVGEKGGMQPKAIFRLEYRYRKYMGYIVHARCEIEVWAVKCNQYGACLITNVTVGYKGGRGPKVGSTE